MPPPGSRGSGPAGAAGTAPPGTAKNSYHVVLLVSGTSGFSRTRVNPHSPRPTPRASASSPLWREAISSYPDAQNGRTPVPPMLYFPWTNLIEFLFPLCSESRVVSKSAGACPSPLSTTVMFGRSRAPSATIMTLRASSPTRSSGSDPKSPSLTPRYFRTALRMVRGAPLPLGSSPASRHILSSTWSIELTGFSHSALTGSDCWLWMIP